MAWIQITHFAVLNHCHSIVSANRTHTHTNRTISIKVVITVNQRWTSVQFAITAMQFWFNVHSPNCVIPKCIIWNNTSTYAFCCWWYSEYITTLWLTPYASFGTERNLGIVYIYRMGRAKLSTVSSYKWCKGYDTDHWSITLWCHL